MATTEPATASSSSSSNTLNSKTNELSLNPLAAAAADVATSLGDQMPTATQQPDDVQTNATDDAAASSSHASSSHQHENNINSSNTNSLLQSLQPLQKSKPSSASPAESPAEPTGRTSPLSPTLATNDTAPAADATSEATTSSSTASSATATSGSPPALPTPAESLTRLLTNSVVEVMEALETLLIYTKNLLLYPDEKKYRKIKMTNIHYQERLGHLHGAIEAMNAIGYIPVGEYLRLDEQRIATGQQRSENATRLKELESYMVERLNELRSQWGNLPLRLNQNHPYKAVQAASCYSAIGKRHNMEDDEIIVDEFGGNENQGYFGLYDGHGGRATVDFVVKALHMNLEHHLRRKPNEALSEAFKQSYLATDGQLRRQNILRSGTTSVTCVIRRDADKRMLFTANVGDSRAILIRNGKAIRLTVDHKASLPEEAKRITDAGGFIGRNKRVNGVLAISRALGDHMLKENTAVVSAEPFTADTELEAGDNYVILACDGVWDVMTDQDAADYALEQIKKYDAQLQQYQQTQANGSTASTNSSITPADSTTASTSANRTPESKLENDVTMSYADDEHPTNNNSTTQNHAAHGAEEISFPKNDNDVMYLVSKALVQEALDRRSLDNVTVMMIKL